MAVTLCCESDSRIKLSLNNKQFDYIQKLIMLLGFNLSLKDGITSLESRRIKTAIVNSLENGKLLEFETNNHSIPFVNHSYKTMPAHVHPVRGEQLLTIRKFTSFVPKTLGIKVL